MKKKLGIAVGVALLVLVVLAAGVAWLALHEVHGKYFDSAGVRIHYTDEGAGVPVVLVHGYSSNATQNWRLSGLHRKLLPQFRVITMDVRGHGLSGKPHAADQYGVEMANDVLRLLDHLKIEKAHVIGYSMGGFIVFKFLSMHPERVITAMPCGAAWMEPGDPLENLANQIYKGQTQGNPNARGLNGLFDTLQRKATAYYLDLEALKYLTASFPQLAITREALGKITVPVMAVKGAEEELVLGGSDPKSALPQYQEMLIPRGKHVNVIFFSEFHRAIIDFLLAHPPAKA